VTRHLQGPDVLAPDAGMQELMSRFGQQAAGGPGVSLDLEASASLDLIVGRAVARALVQADADRARRRAELNAAIFPFDLLPGLIAGAAGSLDQPMTWGPRDGFAFDFKRITFASFTAGTVSVFKGAGASDMTLVQAGFTAGTLYPGGQDWLLQSGERLIFTSTGITGNVTISGFGIMVRHDFLGEYLL
jgi:hypothetical protein